MRRAVRIISSVRWQQLAVLGLRLRRCWRRSGDCRGLHRTHLALRPLRVEGLVMASEALSTHWCVYAGPEVPSCINVVALGITTAAVCAVLSPEAAGADVVSLHVHRITCSADRVSRAEMPFDFAGCFSPGRTKGAKRTSSSGSKRKNKAFHNALISTGTLLAATG